jgi:hypothetical protein
MVRPVILLTAMAAPLASAQPSMRFPFDVDFSGIAGAITVKWDSAKTGGAKVSADLKFDKMDMKALKAFDGNCSSPVTEYTWHIHTVWNMPPNRLSQSASLQGCVKSITGNHYDPYKICGPASEYVDTPACAPKIKDYKCTPDEYKKNFAACESGDLSGKFGSFKPDKNSAVKAEWYDPRFPFFSEVTTKWNIVVHAVCGKATPRVACSGGSVSQKRLHMKSKTVNELEGDADDAVVDDVVDDDDEETTEMQVTDKLHLKFHRHHRAGN